MNWSEITRSKVSKDNIQIILRRLEKASHAEYVVHNYNVKTDDYFNGSYFTDFLEAVDTFVDRCDREHVDPRGA